ncbi:MAG: chemotaxis protein CheW [Alphaproteobacteria bacterium]|nr:chemotaxis protein CheW [Alphaproteobacteria bacterium]MCL2505000.1 chemotaxis protein CheW [Alphaproteobacteria bacterium]
MDDLLSEFLTETAENLATLDVDLVNLEKNPEDPELLSSIFRLVHTVKGTCGFVGLPRLEKLAHVGENILGKFRDNELKVTPAAVDLILACIDRIKFLLQYLEANQKECPDGDDLELINALNACARGENVESPKPPPAAEAAVVAEAPANAADEPDEFGFVPVKAGDVGTLEANMSSAPVHADAPVIAEEDGGTEGVVQEAGANTQKNNGGAVVPTSSANKEEASKAVAATSIADQSIRVNVNQIEQLMTTVSELVLTRNQLLQILRNQRDSAFSSPLQRLNQVTVELQEGVMKTRMQPIGNAWSKLPRLIRDLARELNKKIELQMLGADTELDRQVLELIKDPLTHMVRNSADHGIELPRERLAAGKPETGIITLNAFHEGGHIVIEIIDDGKGLPVNKIKSKIIERGLATKEAVDAMSEQQILQHVFKAGFSTAERVTAVSGRGVGMDVVRTNIEKIGGTIDFKSVEGKGSSFSIKIPLTLAIVAALIVQSGNERFAIPQINVVELVQASGETEHRVELINDTPVLRLRNKLLPLISLKKILKLGDAEIKQDSEVFIVVVQVGSSAVGIIVDQVYDMEEIVVKPVSPILRSIEVFSGNTILGDGDVIMILDLNNIVMHAGNVENHAAERSMSSAVHASSGSKAQSLLVFKAGDDAQKAVPLALVARLEEINVKDIEFSGKSPMVQYRGKLMPLVKIVDGSDFAKEGRLEVLVFADQDKHMGLIVDEILDIVESKLNIDLSAHRPGVLGTAIISEKATDIVDAAYYLSQAFSDWFDVASSDFRKGEIKRVLLVDDSPFFRNLLTPLLTVAGFDVIAVNSAPDALKLQEEGAEFDAIISDIEMPEMTGFEFISRIRENVDCRWHNLPIFAMSSHSTPTDIEKGMRLGFTDYVAKFDREKLIAVLSEPFRKNSKLQNAGGL